MKRILLTCSLIFSSHIFAGQNDSFEKEYLKIMEESNIAQYKEYKFNESHKDKELNEAEKLEAKQLKCASLKSEQRFYELILKGSHEYVSYMEKQGLKIHFDPVKSNIELNVVKQKISFNGCGEE
jgi:hypothetical protein